MSRIHNLKQILPRISAAVGLTGFTAAVLLVAKLQPANVEKIKPPKEYSDFAAQVQVDNEISDEEEENVAETDKEADVHTVRERKQYGNEIKLELSPLLLEINDDKDNPDEIHFGSMILTVPEGWRVESRTNDDGINQCVVIDAHSESSNPDICKHNTYYEHEIEITPYEVLQLPESQESLSSELMHYFNFQAVRSLMEENEAPEASIWLICASDSRTRINDYLLLSESSSGRKELFRIRESDIYDYGNDVEEFFTDFTEQELVKLGDGIVTVPKIQDSQKKDYYHLFNYCSERELLVKSCVQYDGVETIVIDSNDMVELSWFYDEDLYNVDDIRVMDINGDGYEDFLKDCRADYSAEDEDFEGYIFNPDEQEFSYYSGEELLLQYRAAFTVEERIIREESKIPESLIEYISGYILEDREKLRGAMALLVNDRLLSEEEIKQLAKDNIDIKNAMLEIGISNGAGGWIAKDGDNDGIQDVYLMQYLGGSLHSVTHMFFKGAEDGSYSLSYESGGLQEEFAFINWEGKNYLSRTTYNFDQKLFDGICIQSFQDGALADSIWLEITAKDIENADEIEVSFAADEKYRDMAEELCDFRRFTTIEGSSENVVYISEDQPVGSAELYDKDAKGYKWQSDLDNDGEIEVYRKNIWYPSNYYARKCLEVEFEEEALNDRIYQLASEEEGCPLLMWVDETEFGNICYILYENGLYDYYICSYLLSEESCQKLVRVDFRFENTVTVHRSLN